MKKRIYSLALSTGLFLAVAQAATFEEIGVIESIDMGRNLIKVNDQFYHLPSSVRLNNGGEAMLRVQPGYLVGFSGEQKSISSLYIYPESEAEAEENMRDFNEQQGREKHAQ